MGHHSCCNKQKVRRGLWSPEEDEKLINYMSTYGHGCWSSVPKLAGKKPFFSYQSFRLQRCGKSCRLRWINYLRPDLKRGNFSPQEAALIIELHGILGNRWAQIAKHLPGRTDNEVKNFWNSSIKKKLISQGHGRQSPDAIATFSNGGNFHQEASLFSPNTIPSLIPSTQQEQLYLPNPTSFPENFHLGDNLDHRLYENNHNFLDQVQLLHSIQLQYDPSAWSYGHHQPHILNQDQENQVFGNSEYTHEDKHYDQTAVIASYDSAIVVEPICPKSNLIKAGDIGSVPPSSLSQKVDTMARELSSFPCHELDHLQEPYMLVDQNMEYDIDAIMSSLPSLSSSSSRSSEPFIANPSFPSSWET